MIYLWLSKFLLGLGLASYLYSLYSRYIASKNKIAQDESQAKIKTDLETIAQKVKVSDEKVIDFDSASKQFNDDSNKPAS